MEDPKVVSEEFQKQIDESTKFLNDRIQKYSTSVKELLLLNDFNIKEKSMVAPYSHQGIINCLFAERRRLKKLKEKRDEIVEKLIQEHGNADKLHYVVKKEAEQQETVMKINTLIEEQKDVIEYLEEMAKILQNFGFSIKNAVELIKIGNV